MKNQQNQSQLEKEKAQINDIRNSPKKKKKTNTEKTVIFKITQKIIKNK